MELAVNDSNNQENKERDNSDRYNPIGSHSVSSVSGTTGQGVGLVGALIPARHASQRLDTPVHVAFAFQHVHPRVLNSFPLQLQVC